MKTIRKRIATLLSLTLISSFLPHVSQAEFITMDDDSMSGVNAQGFKLKKKTKKADDEELAATQGEGQNGESDSSVFSIGQFTPHVFSSCEISAQSCQLTYSEDSTNQNQNEQVILAPAFDTSYQSDIAATAFTVVDIGGSIDTDTVGVVTDAAAIGLDMLSWF